MTIKSQLIKEFLTHFNEPVLVGYELARVIGFGELLPSGTAL